MSAIAIYHYVVRLEVIKDHLRMMNYLQNVDQLKIDLYYFL